MQAELLDVPPSVGRIVNGLRDTGYDFNSAIADIVDNSISAGASVVDVRFAVDFAGDVILAVVDNGHGMNRAGLMDAMKYGSPERKDRASLGKFGLGLKTASTAFCRRLVVVSRAQGQQDVIRATWDLDRMVKDGWKLLLDGPDADEVKLLDQTAAGEAGTAVVWQSVDRLLPDYKKKQGKPLQNAVNRLRGALEQHLGMVYQRFLDPLDGRASTVELRVNGNKVSAWNPFAAAGDEPDAKHEQAIEMADGTVAQLLVRAFILPRKDEIVDAETRAQARISNELQGVYVYRENRLIHGPDWLDMFKQEPHLSLLRIELSFGHELDEAFQVDIKKSRILLNDQLYDWLRDKVIAHPRREAEVRYRKGVAATAKGASALLHSSSNNAIEQRVSTLETPKVSGPQGGGSVLVENNSGTTKASLRIVEPSSKLEVHVTVSDSVQDGAAWAPVLAAQRISVVLNSSHPFYQKAYLPNTRNTPVVQALDFLLWALAQAEMNNINDANKDAFEQFRIEVSRNLKKLVADLPEAADEVADSVDAA